MINNDMDLLFNQIGNGNRMSDEKFEEYVKNVVKQYEEEYKEQIEI